MAPANPNSASYKLRLSFSGSINDVEEWMDHNCEGDYAYELEDIKETEAVFNKLQLLFSFENDEDRARFKEAVKMGMF